MNFFRRVLRRRRKFIAEYFIARTSKAITRLRAVITRIRQFRETIWQRLSRCWRTRNRNGTRRENTQPCCDLSREGSFHLVLEHPRISSRQWFYEHYYSGGRHRMITLNSYRDMDSIIYNTFD